MYIPLKQVQGAFIGGLFAIAFPFKIPHSECFLCRISSTSRSSKQREQVT